MSRTCKVTYNQWKVIWRAKPHVYNSGTLYIHDNEELYIYLLEAYIHLILYNGTTFRGDAKPPTYLPYMQEHTYNIGTLYTYIY